jgi:hypothetical protein
MNKTKITLLTVSLISITAFVFLGFSVQQDKEPWTQQQLLEPDDLAKSLNNSKSPQPIVYSIGPQAIIKNSIDIGPTVEKANLKKLKQQLVELPKDAGIIIYCGCCPFNKCPNIRPAFGLLNEMGFKNHKLLNLPHNIKVDWIDKGYPVNE